MRSIGSMVWGACRSCTPTGSTATRTTPPLVCSRSAGVRCWQLFQTGTALGNGGRGALLLLLPRITQQWLPLGLTPLQVLKARTIPVDKLNALPGLALELSGSWMESQGGMEHGYEQLRSPSAHASDGDVWRCEPCEP